MMKWALVAVWMASWSAPAVAGCFPPAGLSPQQWYRMCRPDMEDGFARGYGGNMSHDQFMADMYRRYLLAGMGNATPQLAPYAQMPAVGQCALGAVQCFNGWRRQCEMRGAMTMWITGAQRCQ